MKTKKREFKIDQRRLYRCPACGYYDFNEGDKLIL